jgi:hypothetical protein
VEVPPVKVLCGVVHGLYSPWISILEEGQLVTWLSEPFPENFSVVHFHAKPVGKIGEIFDRLHERIRWGGRVPNRILRLFDRFFSLPFLIKIPSFEVSRALPTSISGVQINFPDIYATMRWKDLAILKYFIEETDANFLFMTTSSSYIRPEVLMKYCESFQNPYIYSGSKAYPDANFASGANRILSRSTAQAVLDSRLFWDPAIIEDVALGDILRKNGISFLGYDQMNIPSLGYLSSLSDSELLSNYHFRVKSGSHKERKDAEIMKALSERFKRIDSK